MMHNGLKRILSLKLRSPNSNVTAGFATSRRLSEEESQPKSSHGKDYFRTSESRISNHTEAHLGRIFEVEDGTLNVLGVGPERAPNTLASTAFMDQMDSLGEHCLLIRRPMLELVNYIRQVKSSGKRANFVLWGEYGNGKTTTMNYSAGFCHEQGYIVCNFYQFRNWYLDYKQLQPSERHPDLFDHIARSQTFLNEFIIYNRNKVDHLKTTREYEWSEKETTQLGSPLIDIANKGIERPKFAADCVGALLFELREHCKKAAASGDLDHCRVATVIDGVGALFHEKTLINRKLPEKPILGVIHPAKEQYPNIRVGYFSREYLENSLNVNELSIVKYVKEMLKGDYPNSVVIATADMKDETYMRKWKGFRYQRMADMKPELQSVAPFALLRQEGWELLKPFLPIKIDRYSKSELDIMIDYYLERNFVSEKVGTEAGRSEVHFLTARHPKDFMNLSKSV